MHIFLLTRTDVCGKIQLERDSKYMLNRYRRISDIKNAGFVREEKSPNGTFKGIVTFSDERDGSAEVIVKYFPRGGSRIIKPANIEKENLAAYNKLISIYEKMEQTKEYKNILRGRCVNHMTSIAIMVAALGLGIYNIININNIATGVSELIIAYAAHKLQGWVLRA